MKLHSDTLTTGDVMAACQVARQNFGQDVYCEESANVGSRSRRNGVIFYLESLHGRRSNNRQRSDGVRAASWSAWGYVIAELFNLDPNAIIGQYAGVADFRNQCEAARKHREKLDGEHALDFLKILNDKEED
jgi:hypothetical protein